MLKTGKVAPVPKVARAGPVEIQGPVDRVPKAVLEMRVGKLPATGHAEKGSIPMPVLNPAIAMAVRKRDCSAAKDCWAVDCSVAETPKRVTLEPETEPAMARLQAMAPATAAMPAAATAASPVPVTDRHTETRTVMATAAGLATVQPTVTA